MNQDPEVIFDALQTRILDLEEKLSKSRREVWRLRAILIREGVRLSLRREMKGGTRTPKPEWWKHLRNYVGRIFWKRERKAYKQELKQFPIKERE